VTSKNKYRLDLIQHHKVIVGEGKSDSHFFDAFCAINKISGFAYAFTGMHNDSHNPAGFAEFVRYLPVLYSLAGFEQLTDLVLVCDSRESQDGQFNNLRRQIANVNREIGHEAYAAPESVNVVSTEGMPRVHVLAIPMHGAGGLETICIEVARDHQNKVEGKGTKIQQWVDTFADNACTSWTTEKRDKLRLQAFMSAAWASKPDLHFSQLFEITKNKLVPLDGPAFQEIRDFLQSVAAL
jgi:hypothetical protein